ncbi:MAG: ribosome biogenesis GTPase Der [Candidatus Eremiobacteraeota bacterium]|nr:ribosome biogenesis GTPase Der [Candidatus Eremiobacteraeota bacterium]
MESPATVAIVGRPNVGKSALFNRLVGRRLAIVDDTPGVTRDRLYALAEWRGRTFSVVDTGGIADEPRLADAIGTQTRQQAEAAAREADAIVFVVDAAAGLSALDDDVAMILRRTRRPVLLAANKAESTKVREALGGEFARLGFGEPLPVSAIHGEGTGDLLDAVVEKLPPATYVSPDDELSIAIVGQPNVGKSSLLNALVGEERTIVSDVPGTTRDAIDSLFEWHGRDIRLIDTAGLRRRSSARDSLEYYSSLRALRAIARCDIAILVIDAMRGILTGDQRLAGIILEERKGLIVVANKWDLAQQQGDYSQSELTRIIHDQIPFARFAPVTFLSALTRRRLGSLMPLVARVAENLERRIPTARLNTIVRDAVLRHPPASVGGHPLRILYATQHGVHPPQFVFSCNDPKLVQASYVRYLENILRTNEDFEGVPLILDFRRRSEGMARREGAVEDA